MDAGIEVKMESDDEVEPYDGSYACGFCSESVRGTAALKCSQCSANLVHWVCVAGTKYAGQCATCDGETMVAWRGASAGTGAASEIIDLTDLEAEGAGAAVGAMQTGKGARVDAVPAVGGNVVAADEVGRGAGGVRSDAGRGKGKEPAGADADPEAGGANAETSAGAGGGGDLGNGKGRAENGAARAGRGSRDGEGSGGGSRGAESGQSGGSGSRKAGGEQKEEGSSKRAAPDGDEGGSSGRGGMRGCRCCVARARKCPSCARVAAAMRTSCLGKRSWHGGGGGGTGGSGGGDATELAVLREELGRECLRTWSIRMCTVPWVNRMRCVQDVLNAINRREELPCGAANMLGVYTSPPWWAVPRVSVEDFNPAVECKRVRIGRGEGLCTDLKHIDIMRAERQLQRSLADQYDSERLQCMAAVPSLGPRARAALARHAGSRQGDDAVNIRL